MTIGLCGAHRTGKTTLAEEVSLNTGVELLHTETSQIVKDLGVDLSKPMSFRARLVMQETILNGANNIWSKATGEFVTDRTPLDMLAYTLCDAGPSCEDEWDILSRYMDRCFEISNFYFDMIVLVQPGVELKEEPNKGPLNRCYIEHFNSTLKGLVHDERCDSNVFYIKRDITDLKLRLDAVLHCRDRVAEDMMAAPSAAVFH